MSNQVPKTRSHKGHNLSESCPGRGTAQVCQDMHEPGPLDGEAGVVGRPGLMPYSWGPKGGRRPGPYDQIFWELSGPTPYAAGVGPSVCVWCGRADFSTFSVGTKSECLPPLAAAGQLCCRCVEGHGEEGIYQAANNHWTAGLVAHNVRNLLNKRRGLIVHSGLPIPLDLRHPPSATPVHLSPQFLLLIIPLWHHGSLAMPTSRLSLAVSCLSHPLTPLGGHQSPPENLLDLNSPQSSVTGPVRMGFLLCSLP